MNITGLQKRRETGAGKCKDRGKEEGDGMGWEGGCDPPLPGFCHLAGSWAPDPGGRVTEGT